MFRRKLFWISIGFLLVLGTLSVLSGRPPRTYANVTLIRFTARSLTGLPEVYVEWETATEIDTAGFYVQRSLTNQADSYTRVSPFVPAEGDSVTGALYDWNDITTTLNTTYYYRLEEVPTDAAEPPILYDPVSVVAGVTATQAPPTSSTATRTPTYTPTPTRTPTLTPTDDTPVPKNPPAVSATPHPATGATITPRPITANVIVPPTSISMATQGPAAPTAQSQSPLPATAIPNGGQPAPALTASTQVPNQSAPLHEVAAAVAPAQTAPDVVEPVVVVTEAAVPATKHTESRDGGLLLIIGAAVFLLIGAYFMLRQTSK
jgi:hypothetical protein